MRKLMALAWKELYTTLNDRNLLLIMFASPLALSTIIGLAFGGFGSGSPTLAAIPLAVVNLDQGVNVGALANGSVNNTTADPNTPDALSFNFGTQLANILLSQPLTATAVISGSALSSTFAAPDCSQLIGEENVASDTQFQGSLDTLLAATSLADPAVARAGVEQGDYAVAVIIPPQFTQNFMPQFEFGGVVTATMVANPEHFVEVYANRGEPLAATIVGSIVEGITNQFLRVTVALEATLDTLFSAVNPTQLAPQTLGSALTTVNTDTFSTLGCLFAPGINPITLTQQPLDNLQAENAFTRIIVAIGAAQAVFFALFTGVFGILSIYEERRQWTLQRLLVSPTPPGLILSGKVLGNLVVVLVQLLLLLLALTLIASVVVGSPTFIWGNQPLLLLLLTLALSLCTSGIGTLIVGLARTPEQVQLIGPLLNIALAVLGGSFGFSLPPTFAQLSLIYWGVDGYQKLAAGQPDIGRNLLVLFGQGLLFFVIGTWLFKRRMEL